LAVGVRRGLSMATLLVVVMLGPVAEGRLRDHDPGPGGRRAMQEQAAGAGGPPSSPTPPPGRPHRSGLVRLIPVLVGIMVLTILAVGLMLYRHVTRLTTS
jgi:hypothetical protein